VQEGLPQQPECSRMVKVVSVGFYDRMAVDLALKK
jgi:hypothetical protein